MRGMDTWTRGTAVGWRMDERRGRDEAKTHTHIYIKHIDTDNSVVTGREKRGGRVGVGTGGPRGVNGEGGRLLWG